jgi:hypothetical protein
MSTRGYLRSNLRDSFTRSLYGAFRFRIWAAFVFFINRYQTVLSGSEAYRTRGEYLGIVPRKFVDPCSPTGTRAQQADCSAEAPHRDARVNHVKVTLHRVATLGCPL